MQRTASEMADLKAFYGTDDVTEAQARVFFADVDAARVATGTYDEDGNRTVLAEMVKAFGEDGGPVVSLPQMSISDAVEHVGMMKREWESEEMVILVHPLDSETVVDALRRHFEAAGMGTVRVATADGPRDVDVPAALAGVAVIESTLIPAGEIRIAPRASALARVGTLTIG